MLVCECTQLPLSKCGGHEIICGCMLFPAIWFQDSNAGCQALWEAPSLAGPSHWPLIWPLKSSF